APEHAHRLVDLGMVLAVRPLRRLVERQMGGEDGELVFAEATDAGLELASAGVAPSRPLARVDEIEHQLPVPGAAHHRAARSHLRAVVEPGAGGPATVDEDALDLAVVAHRPAVVLEVADHGLGDRVGAALGYAHAVGR